MDNRPHSRQKKVVDKAVKVEKKKLDTSSKAKPTSFIKSIFSNLIKK